MLRSKVNLVVGLNPFICQLQGTSVWMDETDTVLEGPSEESITHFCNGPDLVMGDLRE